MTLPETPKLISFTICPFVQRARVLLNSKEVDYSIEYIDLANRPDWFTARVPTGKVPALFVGEETLFESAAINEYLDEVTPGSALSETPIGRALDRAWISLTDDAIMAQYRMMLADNAAEFEQQQEALAVSLTRFASVAQERAEAEDLSLLDAAIAPVFTRLAEIPTLRNRLAKRLSAAPEVMAWGKRLLALAAVKASVGAEFSADFRSYFAERGSFALAPNAMEPA